MKEKIFILICCVTISSSLFFCNKQDNIETIITKVDMEEMAHRHLPYFNLLRERSKYVYGREYVFVRESDSANIFITIGLHQSEKDAENIANNYFSEISMVMKEGPHQGVTIGDKYWWLAPFQDSSILTDIVFIRKNALFIMSSHSYEELKELAKKIDDDIIIDANYVELENKILLPVIDSITASKTELKEGDTTKITIHASDPNNESLEYDAIGIGHYEPDPENVFTLISSPSNVPDPFWGSHVYEFIVINESNVVSEIAEFEIIISE